MVFTYQDHPSRVTNDQYRVYLNDDARATLDRMKEGLEGVEDVVTEAIADLSPARALQELAVRESAALVVLGSTHRGTLGRVIAGTTAERLLHGAPCSVAVVPDGFRMHADTRSRPSRWVTTAPRRQRRALSAAVMTSQFSRRSAARRARVLGDRARDARPRLVAGLHHPA